MSLHLPHPLATTLSTLFSLILLFAFYIYQLPSTLNFSTPHPHHSTNDIPGLSFTLAQTSTSPLTLLVALQNTHPSITYTLLKWATPIDTSALDTGVFTITAPDGTKIQQVIRKITRKMPPPPSQIVTLRPGMNVTREVLFDVSDMARPGKYKVQTKGMWKGGWAKERADVTTEDLWAFAGSEFSGWRFGTEMVDVVVD